ncbi:MAG: DUF192 domain-containing protein [Methylobacteriaceae bacterium]|nr:DUF192 domain-containing protein [Methylobacteriaceae bacterium]
MTFALRVFLLRLLAAIGLAAALAAPIGPAVAQEQLELLMIQSGETKHMFSVEVMRSDAERAKGLMFRRYMAADRGMLFDFKVEQPVTMWMKNTFLPLDMIFIRKTGEIAAIAENTEPMSERIIPSGAAVLSVLEVNAGTTARLGIKVGDRVVHALFKP